MNIVCEYRNTNAHPVCKLGLYKGMPSFKMCLICVDNNQNNPEYAAKTKESEKITGLGDVIHKIANPIAGIIDKTLRTNIQRCGGCRKRQQKLNKLFPISVE